LILSSTNARIFPCKIKPVLPNFTEYKDSYCGLSKMNAPVGIAQRFTSPGYVLLIVWLIIIPYLLACTLNALLEHHKK
jgi:hypothetical protein